MSVEELLVWAVVWVPRYALHPPLWDAVAWWTYCKTQMSKTSQLFGDVFWPLSFSFLKPAHTHTHTHICCNNYILHSHTPPPHAKTLCYINMQQSLWCIIINCDQRDLLETNKSPLACCWKIISSISEDTELSSRMTRLCSPG